jgi:hypothetical protein
VDVLQVDSVKLEVSSNRKTKWTSKSEEVASGRASGSIYTPCLEPKDSAHAKTSKGVAGNTMLGMLVAFLESCPWGLCRGLWGPNIFAI